jgi:carbamate kinase
MEIWDCNGEGAVGCMLQGFLLAELTRRGMRCPVISLIPEVEIAAEDQALARPDHPFGEPYSAEQAKTLKRRKGWSFQPLEDGRFRRLIPVPAPAAVGDLDIIRILLENGAVVIAGAGNRMPRYCQVQGESRQEEVFIDGHRLGALLSTSLEADALIVVTGQGESKLVEPGTMKETSEGPEAKILEAFLRTWRAGASESPASQVSIGSRHAVAPPERAVHVFGDKSQGYA